MKSGTDNNIEGIISATVENLASYKTPASSPTVRLAGFSIIVLVPDYFHDPLFFCKDCAASVWRIRSFSPGIEPSFPSR